ncbi:MAG TPA: molybdopterin-synthase adenylyltransferase MoeB [Trueperaceae bacterium]|nr:molybdopterin-synthase adenylyltransferase MoeB [Trueperaceae bacterium]
MFTREQLDRYARHIILPGVGAAGQRRLLGARVLVVGAGGLGSPILLYLAAAGVGTIHLVDDERVEASNLQRQVVHGLSAVGTGKTASVAARLADLNPDVTLVAHPERLTGANARGLVRDCELVIDGSDNFPTRYLVNDACVLEGRPLVYGALSQFEGQVSVFAAEQDGARGPCYRCLFPQPPEPGSVPSCAEAGVFGVLPGIVGSFMANEALKLLLGLGAPLVGTLLHVDAAGAEVRRFELARDPGCPVCGDDPSVTELVDYEAFCGVA